MADQYSEITDKLKAFIEQQHMFFVASADVDGHVNVSPKGADTLRVINSNRIVWLNLTGSGNETAAHMLATNRMTIMFCSFDTHPMILRLYCSGRTVYPNDDGWEELMALFTAHDGARQIFDLDVEMVLTSCGYQVPYYDYTGERETLDKWTENKGPEGVRKYWDEFNKESLDGKPTGL